MKYTIIGAGIAGLTTALALERKGIDYEVFEKAPSLNEVGAGIWLAPNALQVLESLGILEEVKMRGNAIDRILLAKQDLSPLSDNFQDRVKAAFGYTTVAIHRAELQKLLFESIPREKIHLGKGLAFFEYMTDRKARIIFDDHSTCKTDFLIGADGINSKVRKQLFPESETRYSGQTCWRGVADFQLADEFSNRGMELWGDQVRFGISKVGGSKVYWFAVALSKPNQRDENILLQEKLLEMFAGFHPLVKELIAATPEHTILRNDISDLKPLKNWYKDSICLIGDAAHATTPNMGQGGAQAIEDAYYLSSFIEKWPKENIFERFQQKRKRKVSSIVKRSWTTGKMAHWKYGRGVRNFILKTTPSKFVEKQMLTMYQIEKM